MTTLADSLADGAAGRIIPLPADLTDENQVDRLIAATLAHGPVDIVISNAGRSICGRGGRTWVPSPGRPLRDWPTRCRP